MELLDVLFEHRPRFTTLVPASRELLLTGVQGDSPPLRILWLKACLFIAMHSILSWESDELLLPSPVRAF